MGDNLTENPRILVVDDSRVIRHAATKMLAGEYSVREAENGMLGWQLLQQDESISVAFVDLQMPEMNGLELLTLIRSADDERLASLPVIMITGAEDSENTKQQVFEAGATDFITKPFVAIDLLSRARSYARLNRKVTELENQASRDSVTGLLNAASLLDHGARALSFALRHRTPLTLVCAEIADFRQVYQSYGKRIAQQIVNAIAKRMRESMRTEDVAARTGVARFALLLPLTGEAEAHVVVERIHDSIGKLVFDTGSEKIGIRLVSGVVAATLDESLEFSALLAQADKLLASAINGDGEPGLPGSIEAHGEAGAAADPAADFSEADIIDALKYVVAGEFSRIPAELLHPLADRLVTFFDYVNSPAGQRVASANFTQER